MYLYCEKLPKICYLTNTTLPCFYISSNWFYLYNQILSTSSSFFNTTLLEHTIIHNTNYIAIPNITKNSLLSVYVYYNYMWDIKWIVYSNTHTSLNLIFKNTIWLERESSEMYGVVFTNMFDTRKLLLEYSSIYNPLLKTFNVESYKDVNYNIFLGDVVINQSEVIEL